MNPSRPPAPASPSSKRFRRILGFFLGVLLRIWLCTLRLTLIIDPQLRALLSARGEAPWILALWHGQQMALLKWPRRRSTVVLVSHSLDGELLSAVLLVLGFAVERGSSSHGGALGLLGVVRRLRRGFDAAFAVDGPRGPRHAVVALGAPRAAALAKGVIVPMGAACTSAWTLRRTWDHFEIPKPFARVAIALGAPLFGDSSESGLSAPALARAIHNACAAAKRELQMRR